MKLFNMLKQNIIVNKIAIITYLSISFIYLTVIFVFFSGDYGNGSDVIVILDGTFIWLFVLVSYPFIAHIIFDDKRLIASRTLYKNTQVTYVIKFILTLLVTYILPIIYLLIKLWPLNIDTMNRSSYLLYLLITIPSIIVFLLYQYYMNIIRFKVKSRMIKLIPVILIAVYVVFYIVLGLTFEALVFNQNTSQIQYFEYLHLLENIAYIFAGLLFVIFIRFQIKLYGTVNV